MMSYTYIAQDTTMNFEKFANLFTEIYTQTKTSEKFLDSVPSSIRGVFAYNQHVNAYYAIQNLLIKEVFPEKMLYDIEYFLFDFDFGFQIFDSNGNEYFICDLNGILEYFYMEHFRVSTQ
jgi:hypothetical protein